MSEQRKNKDAEGKVSTETIYQPNQSEYAPLDHVESKVQTIDEACGDDVTCRPGLAQVQTISKDQLLAKIKDNDGIQIVNVLKPEQYGKGFIKGSKKIPLDQIDNRSGELDKTKEVVTYCAGSECSASMKAAEKLAVKGFRVKAFEGGIKEWSQAGLPIEN